MIITILIKVRDNFALIIVSELPPKSVSAVPGDEGLPHALKAYEMRCGHWARFLSSTVGIPQSRPCGATGSDAAPWRAGNRCVFFGMQSTRSSRPVTTGIAYGKWTDRLKNAIKDAMICALMRLRKLIAALSTRSSGNNAKNRNRLEIGRSNNT
jgi:hypothetical protein